MSCVVGIDGKPHDLRVESGEPVLHQSALDAVRQWRFTPAKLDGQPTEVRITVQVVIRVQYR